MKRKSRRTSSSQVMASTAGLDSWKTWAGRSQGNDDFELWDLVRGVQRKCLQAFVWTTPSAGTCCPVCFTTPTSPSDWHVTSACGHAVCIDCLQAYAANQVRDPFHVGPLKCPCCSMPLREKDAIVAMQSEDLIQAWDYKLRDQLLRALPNFRSCPNCSRANQQSNASAAGGGFVTPECLTPHHERREQQALQILYFLPVSTFSVFGLYLLMAWCIHTYPSKLVSVDLVAMILPIPIFIRFAGIVHALVAQRARQALQEPICVECPCCDSSFVLSAQSELSHDTNDDQTNQWIMKHTRPCPSCSAPIHKSGGCNHMKCSHCRVSFCWACMKTRTNCGAYQCHYGAPYRNATRQFTLDSHSLSSAPEPMSLMDRLERLEQRSSSLSLLDGFFVGALLWGRDWPGISMLVSWLLSMASMLLTSGVILMGVWTFVVGAMVYEFLTDLERRRERGRRQLHPRLQQHHHGQRPDAFQPRTISERIAEAFTQPGPPTSDLVSETRAMHMTETQMLALAMLRSLQDQ